jgi:hypothetical protein
MLNTWGWVGVLFLTPAVLELKPRAPCLPYSLSALLACPSNLEKLVLAAGVVLNIV